MRRRILRRVPIAGLAALLLIAQCGCRRQRIEGVYKVVYEDEFVPGHHVEVWHSSKDGKSIKLRVTKDGEVISETDICDDGTFASGMHYTDDDGGVHTIDGHGSKSGLTVMRSIERGGTNDYLFDRDGDGFVENWITHSPDGRIGRDVTHSSTVEEKP